MTNRDGFRTGRRLIVALLLTAALASGGCSFSYSSKSSSDSSKSSSESSSSPFDSSSASSSSDRAAKQSYQQDIADYTKAYVISGGADSGFPNGIGDIARKHGVSDWESDQSTWEGVGAGLAAANVKPDQLDTYKNNWGAGDPEAMKSIQRGYDRAR